MADLIKTPLYDSFIEQGAKMVPFAGFEMPIQFSSGVLKEHLHTREKAGLFDVSHMGQIILHGKDCFKILEKLLPVDVLGLKVNRQRYGFFTNENGGIIDDLMFVNRDSHIFMVVNAARKSVDIEHLKNFMDDGVVEVLEDRALLALQGPMAENALCAINPAIKNMRFMDFQEINLAGIPCWVTRSGYSGEDGFEISVHAQQAVALANALISNDFVELIGLGARDSLRLEAGLCLYDHDIDEVTSPIEASLSWAIQKARRHGGDRAGGFLGDTRILRELKEGAKKRRVGLRPEGRAPMREGVKLFSNCDDIASDDLSIGHITSGGFSPSIGCPIAMGYVSADKASIGTSLYGEVRGKAMRLEVCSLPFVTPNFKR